MTKQIQKGFTLIELMIVVAIIGILAAIAIPQYGNYIARTQVSEAVSLLAGYKTAIEEYVHSNGTFPAETTAGTVADPGLSAGPFADLGGRNTGTYVALISSDPGADATDSEGKLVATMKTTAAGANGNIDTETLELVRQNDDWTCTRGATSSVGDTYLPNQCKNAAVATADL